MIRNRVDGGIAGWKRRIYAIVAVILSMAAVAPVNAAPMTPMESIKDLDRQVEKYKIGKTLTAEETAYNRQLKADIMKGTFDIRTLSEISLGRHWATLTPEQQGEFVDLMTQLLQNKAIFAKEQSQTRNKNYRITYQKEAFLDDKKTTAEVFTSVTVPSENVTLNLNYKLKRNVDAWKIFDVIVDQSSLVKNYAYQFNAIITKYGYPELVRRMKAKLAELQVKGGIEPSGPSAAAEPAAGAAVTDAPIATAPTEPVPAPPAPAPQPALQAAAAPEKADSAPKKGFFSCSLSRVF